MKSTKWDDAMGVVRSAATKVKFPLDADRPFGVIQDECYIAATLLNSSSAGALIQFAAIGFAYYGKTLEEADDTPAKPGTYAATREGILLNRLISDIGPDKIWQALREWTYGTMEIPDSERMPDSMEHEVASSVRRLDRASAS